MWRQAIAYKISWGMGYCLTLWMALFKVESQGLWYVWSHGVYLIYEQDNEGEERDIVILEYWMVYK
jgi:hypothetical protein